MKHLEIDFRGFCFLRRRFFFFFTLRTFIVHLWEQIFLNRIVVFFFLLLCSLRGLARALASAALELQPPAVQHRWECEVIERKRKSKVIILKFWLSPPLTVNLFIDQWDFNFKSWTLCEIQLLNKLMWGRSCDDIWCKFLYTIEDFS